MPEKRPTEPIPSFAESLPSSSVQERFGLAIGDVNRAWRDRLDQRLKPLGLSQSKWRALLYVSRCPDGINQTDLARMLGIEAPTLTRLIQQLEEAGWIRRRPLAADARCKIVHVTPRARKVIAQIDDAVQQLRAETLGRLTDAQAAAGLDAMLTLKRLLQQG